MSIRQVKSPCVNLAAKIATINDIFIANAEKKSNSRIIGKVINN